MRRQLTWTGVGVALLLGLSGCPMTDDYYIEAASSGSTGKAGQATGGSSPQTGGSSGQAQGGSGAQASAASSSLAGDAASGGADGAGAPSVEAGAGSGGSTACVPKTERCNGHDDDCDGLDDETACGVTGTYGCFGFTLEGRDDHGYMLCYGNNKRDWTNAVSACEAQDMRLAWIETKAENTNLSGKINAAGGVTEVLFGGTDEDKEGDWYWDGGNMFWKGAADGYSVDGAFEAWNDSTPNNSNNEDCIVLFPATATWGDRTCTANYAYLCEEREPAE